MMTESGAPTLAQFLLARIADDEARALAESKAKRRIVGDLTEDPKGVHEWWWDRDVASPLLAVMASAYGDHPDYRQEWRQA